MSRKLKGRFMTDSAIKGVVLTGRQVMDRAAAQESKPQQFSNDEMRLLHKAYSRGVTDGSGIGSHVVSAEEEARNIALCEQQGLSGASYPASGENNKPAHLAGDDEVTAIDAYFTPQDAHTSMDQVFGIEATARK